MTRQCLAARRAHELADFHHGGLDYTVCFSRYPNGHLAEIFIDCARRGSAAEVAARDGAVLASLCLQHGVTADAIRHAMVKLANGSAAGPIGKALQIAAEAA